MQGGVQRESLMESAIKEVFEISLDPKGEVVKYRDDVDIYYFSLRRKNRRWIVYLPATKLAPYRRHELTEDGQKVIIPRIRSYLEHACLLSTRNTVPTEIGGSSGTTSE